MLGLARIALFGPEMSHRPMLIAMSRQGRAMLVGRRSESLVGFEDGGGCEVDLPLVLDDPARAAGLKPVVSGPQGLSTESAVGRVIALGSRWQTIADSQNPAPEVRTLNRARASDGMPTLPLHVDPCGMIRNQSYWKGKPFRLLGFVHDLSAREIAVEGKSLFIDPAQCSGMLPVMADWDGTIATYPEPVTPIG